MWILVVEDETSMREALRQGLEEENHTVALASDGLEGIHAAETCDFDAILLDVMMPGMDGIDLVRRLPLPGFSIPLVLFSLSSSFPHLMYFSTGTVTSSTGFMPESSPTVQLGFSMQSGV